MTVFVEGLKDFVGDLRTMGRELPRELTRVHRLVAEAMVRGTSDKAEGSLGSDIRAKSTPTTASVAGGRTKPHFGVREFGGTIPRMGFAGTQTKTNPETGRPARTRVRPYRGLPRGAHWWDTPGGYFFMTAAREMRESVVEMYAELLEVWTKRTFPI